MRRAIVLDFETASTVDLKACGAHVYAEHPNTEILCLSWNEIGENPQPNRWAPTFTMWTRDLFDLAADRDVIFIAHNCAFEKAIWRNIMVPAFGFPDVPNDRWHDTLAVCAMKSLPLKLERALAVLDLGSKDTAGTRHTVAMSKPNKAGHYDRSPEKLQRVFAYCDDDVAKELALHRRVGSLGMDERRVWLLDQTINERGVSLDLQFVRQARRVVEEATIPLASEFKGIVGCDFTKIKQVKDWVNAQGVPLENMQKETIAALIGVDIDATDESLAGDGAMVGILPPSVRRALYIRNLIGSASVKKLGAMERCVCADGRARGLLQYHGAGTGRWAGRLFQPQNLPMGTIKLDDEAPPPETMVEAIMTGDPSYVEAVLGSPVETVLSALRHAIVPAPGRLLGVGDFAGVEARLVLALAGQHDKTELMASGVDVYCDMASDIYQRPINKHNDPWERKIGKNTVLGCGFQMGAPKFQARYADHMPLEFCQGVIQAYRKTWAPLVPKLWYALQDAARDAAMNPGKPFEAYGVTYRTQDSWLTARLPSGRKLWYNFPRTLRVPKPWAKDELQWVWYYKANKNGQWRTVQAYGGLLTENVIQGLARDLMVRAMTLCEEENLPVILTVHDEIVVEPEATRTDAATVLRQIMEDRPQWAIEIKAPIAAETWQGDRYRK